MRPLRIPRLGSGRRFQKEDPRPGLLRRTPGRTWGFGGTKRGGTGGYAIVALGARGGPRSLKTSGGKGQSILIRVTLKKNKISMARVFVLWYRGKKGFQLVGGGGGGGWGGCGGVVGWLGGVGVSRLRRCCVGSTFSTAQRKKEKGGKQGSSLHIKMTSRTSP